MKRIILASLREQLYESITDAILTNQYIPGEILQIDRLANEFGVSTTPVREALVRLESAGLVKLIPNKGAQVAAIQSQDVLDVWEARKVFEPYVAKEAATKADMEDVRKVHTKLSYVLDNPLDFEAYIQSDIELHEILFRYTNNAVLRQILEKLAQHYTRIRYFAEADPKMDRSKVLMEITKEHVEIANALLAGDPDMVADAVCQHLENGEKRTLAALNKRHSSDPANTDR